MNDDTPVWRIEAHRFRNGDIGGRLIRHIGGKDEVVHECASSSEHWLRTDCRAGALRSRGIEISHTEEIPIIYKDRQARVEAQFVDVPDLPALVGCRKCGGAVVNDKTLIDRHYVSCGTYITPPLFGGG